MKYCLDHERHIYDRHLQIHSRPCHIKGSLSLPCFLAIKSSLVYFLFLSCFSGSSSTSSLSEESLLLLSLSCSLPLSVSASEIEILLGSLTGSEDSTTFLCFFFFFLEGALCSMRWESCSIFLGCLSGYRGSCVETPPLVVT